VVIEHNLDVIKTADWILDMGPEGGRGGGRLVVAGPPEAVVAYKESHTGRHLKPSVEIVRRVSPTEKFGLTKTAGINPPAKKTAVVDGKTDDFRRV
jgi:hypothetical protein